MSSIIMRLSILFLVLFLNGTAAFMHGKLSLVRHSGSMHMVQVELVPEPDGGEEMNAIKSMAGSRMKNMGENADVKNDDGTVYKFWLLSVAEADLIKEIRTQIMKDAKKKANFPGFRKGQIPPYAHPQITGFAVQEAVIKTVEAAVEAYGLKSLAGSDGEINVQEDVAELAKGWKDGESLTFTTTFSAILDPEQQSAAGSDASEEEKEEIESS